MAVIHSIDLRCRCHIFDLLKRHILSLLDSDDFKDYQNRSKSVFLNHLYFSFDESTLSSEILDSGIYLIEFSWNLDKNLVDNLIIHSNMKLIELMNKYLFGIDDELDTSVFSLFHRNNIKLIIDKEDYNTDSLLYFLPFSFIRYKIDFSKYKGNLCLYSFSHNNLTNSDCYRLFPYWYDYLDKNLYFNVLNENLYLPLNISLLSDAYTGNIIFLVKLLSSDRLYNLRYKLSIYLDKSTYKRFIDDISSLLKSKIDVDIILNVADKNYNFDVLKNYFNNVLIVCE